MGVLVGLGLLLVSCGGNSGVGLFGDYNGKLNIETGDVATARQQTRIIVEEGHRGQLEKEDTTFPTKFLWVVGRDDQAVLTFRVPAEEFDATLVDLLVSEVRQVDGVKVEEVRTVGPEGHDPRSATLETAARLVGARTRSDLLVVARDVAPRSLSAAWVAVVDLEASEVLAAGDRAPGSSWLVAFVHGARTAEELGGATGQVEPTGSDVIWSKLPEVDLAVVAGRDKIAWRERERRELDALAHIVSLRWSELPA